MAGPSAPPSARGARPPPPYPDAKHGDYRINGVLPFAKARKENPRALAEAVVAKLAGHEALAKAEVAGPGFVNLTLDPAWLARTLGAGGATLERAATPEKVVIDFSSPNIAKQMHVGHLRSTILGQALVRILRALGHEVVGVNHLGDWGASSGCSSSAGAFGDEAPSPPRPSTSSSASQARLRPGEGRRGLRRARAELAKLQSGSAAHLARWRTFVDASLAALEATYRRLDVAFDLYRGESAYHDELAGVVDLLVGKGLARESEGALGVFFAELPGAPPDLAKIKEPWLVRKRDGAYLYATTDVAAVFHRSGRSEGQLAGDRLLYVVDARQGLHFRQLFAVARMLGVTAKLEHVSFGAILGQDGKPLKTRDGGTISLASLLDESIARAKARIVEEGLEVAAEDLDAVARAVGIGAVKYADLRQNRASDYVFDWDKMISFKGNAGPYLQYAYARARSVLRKGETTPDAARGAPLRLDAPEELSLGKTLVRFAEVVHAAADTSQPHLASDPPYAPARYFSSFYEACPVLRSGRAPRLAARAHGARGGPARRGPAPPRARDDRAHVMRASPPRCLASSPAPPPPSARSPWPAAARRPRRHRPDGRARHAGREHPTAPPRLRRRVDEWAHVRRPHARRVAEAEILELLAPAGDATSFRPRRRHRLLHHAAAPPRAGSSRSTSSRRWSPTRETAPRRRAHERRACHRDDDAGRPRPADRRARWTSTTTSTTAWRTSGAPRRSSRPRGGSPSSTSREDSPMGPPPDLRLSADVIVAEMGRAGYTLAQRSDALPYQFVLIFRR